MLNDGRKILGLYTLKYLAHRNLCAISYKRYKSVALVDVFFTYSAMLKIV